MIKNLLSHYPWLRYLIIIAEHCPHTLRTYLLTCDKLDDQNRLIILKKDISSEFLIRSNQFENHMLSIAREGLISMEKTPKFFCIECVDWDTLEDEIC
jgi:hypothetical protein